MTYPLGLKCVIHSRVLKRICLVKKDGAYAMKRVAAGAHLPTPWPFEPVKRPDDRAI